MSSKKIYLFIISTLLMMFVYETSSAAPVVYQKDLATEISINADDSDDKETSIIEKVSLKNKFKRSPESQITSFFKKYNYYSMKNDIEKLKELYTDDYINNDGFNKETIFKMMEMASDTYKNINYNTVLTSIKVDGNYAVVKVHEIVKGETTKPIGKIEGTGTIMSDIYYTDYLKKEGNKWKLSVSQVDYEKVDLKYGEAKSIDINVSSPNVVSEGSEYEVNVKTKTPAGVFVVGSIVNDQIVYPQVQSEDVYRSVKYEELDRILRANKNNNNEYATISIALTRAEVEPPSLVLNMTGIAIVMKRVNIVPFNKNVKIDKES